MRIALVRPSMSGVRAGDAMQPLVFALLAALTPSGVALTFHDELVEPLPEVPDADAVALTVETFAARRAYQLADRWRARGVPVIMGGFHPSMCPDEAAEHADAVVVGEAEDTWPRLLADLAAGRLASRYDSTCADGLGGVRFDTSVFAGKRYAPLGLVQFGRGCRFACDFCSIHAFFGARIRTRPVAEVVAEIARRPERMLFFVDDNLYADPAAARELLEELVPLRRRFACQLSMDVAGDPALLRLLHRAGCRVVVVGFESTSPATLRAIGKGANLHADYERVIRAFHAARIMIYGTFVVGYDADSARTPADAADFAIRHRFAVANFNPLMPMPGTRLYDRLKGQGRLIHDRWWIDPAYRYGDAMLVPTGMTPAELTDGCRAARFAFNTPACIARRLAHPAANAHSPANAALFLAANLVSRREIRAKQGRRLGASG
nr:B12-binding domain-containing radical SAM protein [Propionibacterium sp.]